METVRKMSIRVFVAALAFTLAGGHALSAEPEAKLTEPEAKSAEEPKMPQNQSEPVKCMRLIGIIDDEMPMGLAVELCAATPKATKTFDCYMEAFMPSSAGGLGLTRGLAVDLCRTIPRERP
jgi:hypothetical protein